ncbi:MAG: RNA polymerase-binding protein DksA [Desulfuromonadales bacterium]|nr:RNA polymerase-binding protein DksA [Desulfuromonadales bacterium]
MCPGHLAYFRHKLLDWRRQVLQESQGALERIRTARSREGDLVDQGMAESDLTLDLANRERSRVLLEQIDAALARIEDGSYGFCEETGEEIGLRRLEARPLATLSIEAQERHELMVKRHRLQ